MKDLVQATTIHRPWEVITTWGDRTLSAEVIDTGARHALSLGSRRDDDVQLGHPAHIDIALDGEGLRVEFTQGVTGALKKGGDWPRALDELVSSGTVREAGDRWQLSLTRADELALRVGRLRIEVREAKVAPSRLPIEAAGPAVLLLAIAAVLIVVFSVVAPAQPFPSSLRAPTSSCGTGVDPACAMTRGGKLPLDESTFHSVMGALRTADPPLRPRLAQNFLVSRAVTARQLQQFLAVLGDESARLELARFAADKVVDPAHALGFADSWADRDLARQYADALGAQLIAR